MVQAPGRQEHAYPGQFLDELPHVGVHLVVWCPAAAVDRHQEPHYDTSEIYSAVSA
jgi:hypothetical protein